MLSQALTGPVQLSVRDQVAAIGDALGRPVPVVAESREDAVARLGAWVSEAEADAICQFCDDCTAGSSPATTTARTVLGREPLSFATWAFDHTADFR